MEKVKAWINVDPCAAVLAGKTEHGYALVEVDAAALSEAQRQVLAGMKVGRPYGPTFSDEPQALCLFGGEVGGVKIAEATPAAVTALLDAALALREQKATDFQAKVEKGVAAYLSAPVEKLVDAFEKGVDGRSARACGHPEWQFWRLNDRISYRLDIYDEAAASAVLADPRTAEKHAEVVRACEDHNAAATELLRAEFVRLDTEKRRNEEKAAAAKAEAEAAAVRRQAQLGAWVAQHGTDNQRGRHGLGLLPESEILDGIRAVAYAVLDGFGRYDRLDGSDIPCACEYDEVDSSFETADATEATDAEFERLAEITLAIKAVHPESAGVTVALREHVGSCDRCGAKVIRKSIRVALTVGELSFSREYAAKKGDD